MQTNKDYVGRLESRCLSSNAPGNEKLLFYLDSVVIAPRSL